jgi:hypothetical protein
MNYEETNNSDNSSRLTNLLWGVAAIVIGGAIVYYLFWKPKQQTAQQLSLSGNVYNSQYEDLYQGMTGIASRIRMLESKISDTQNIQAQMNQVSQPITTNPSFPGFPSSYKNNEKWLITRSRTGHIDSLEIVRDAKMNK